MPRSAHRRAREPHHLAPFLGFVGNELALRKTNLARLLRDRPDGLRRALRARRDRSRPVSGRLQHGPRGLVSKRADRPYRAGRCGHWIKVKNRQHPAMYRVKDVFSWVMAIQPRVVVSGAAVAAGFVALRFPKPAGCLFCSSSGCHRRALKRSASLTDVLRFAERRFWVAQGALLNHAPLKPGCYQL